MMHLVLGGARSGKSSFSESWLLSHMPSGNTPIYIATAQALDGEMNERIAHHQQQRADKNWQLVEVPLNIASALNSLEDNSYVLIDCLTLWLTNQLMSQLKLNVEVNAVADYLTDQSQQLVDALTLHATRLNLVIVSNEVGLGIVPLGEQSRLFVDHAGWLNQKVAAVAEQVTLVSAGLPLSLKNKTSEFKGVDCG